MKYEVEQKYRYDANLNLQQRLNELHAAWHSPCQQSDVYYAHPSRDFAETDEALRIRSIGKQNFVTYKGPKIDRTTKTRHEIELPLAPGADGAKQFGQLLVALGFRVVAEVRKQRHSADIQWEGRKIEASLDDVETVGHFAELEILAEQPDLDAARACLASLAAKLGLSDVERRSYLEMQLEKSGEDI